MPTETRNIIILGASYAGLGAAHYTLRHVLPKLPTDDTIGYQVIVVDPSAKWYARTASPRAVVKAHLIPEDKVFIDLAPAFAPYGERVRLVQGKATAWDPAGRTVTIQGHGGARKTTPYHALVLATGTRATSAMHSLQGGGHEEVEQAVRAMRSQLAGATRIVVAGGGPTGVETAGEIAAELNGSPGWFASRLANPRVQITLVTTSSKLLPLLKPSAAEKAEHYLRRVGVDVRYNVKVASTRTTDGGKTTTVVFHDGTEIVADIYIAAAGTTPMTEYVPGHLRTEKGYVKMNEQTLRVDAAGPRVYAVGDVGSYEVKDILYILSAVPVAMTNLQRDLLAAHADGDGKPTGGDRLFVPAAGPSQLVPVGRSKGVGSVFGWSVPSLFVWLLKGRDYMISRAEGTVNGDIWKEESKWKPT